MKPTILLLGLTALPMFAQHPKGSLLVIDVQNQTQYNRDTADTSKLATEPGPTTGVRPLNFGQLILIGDIVAVNGQPVTGTAIEVVTKIDSRPDPAPGQAIADATRFGLYEWNFEIMSLDGRQIGSLRMSGMGQGPPPAGATRNITTANHVVIGGTGAFLGVRGYMGASLNAPQMSAPPPTRSMTESPAYRRINGGGSLRQSVYVLPMLVPEIVTGPNGSAVFHADLTTMVTAANPARAGETVTLRMTGLGPTIPGVEPGDPFPADALQPVNSPVDALVNGITAEVINSIGWPATVGEYRIDVRIPDSTTAGTAKIRVSAAWIQGPEFSIAVR